MIRTLRNYAAQRVARFRQETSGVASVELALLLPVMIGLYFGAVELSNALIADRKLNKTGSAVADLTAQATSINNDAMADIFRASSAIMDPFGDGTLRLVVSSVVADSRNRTRVAWSDAQNGTAYSPGASYNLPPGLTQPGTSVIVAEASYTYTSPIGQYLTGGLSFETTYYLRPRRVTEVARVR